MTDAATTRTPAFEARLRKRYRAEKRFKALGLTAILCSVAVLLFLLGTMLMNGAGGFQRAELEVPIDFTQAGMSVDTSGMSQGEALQRLQAQGLPDLVQFAASKHLGDAGAAGLSPEAWREVGQAIVADPSLLSRQQTFSLPASGDLAAALDGDGKPETRALAAILARDGKLAQKFDGGFLTRSDA